MKFKVIGGETIGGCIDYHCGCDCRILYTEDCIQGIENRFAVGCSRLGGLLPCGVWFFKRFVLE